MTWKVKFDRERATCTAVVMYPSHEAQRLYAYLKDRGFPCDLRFRGEEEGSTITFSDVPWRDVVEALERFLGRTILRERERKAPPTALHIPKKA